MTPRFGAVVLFGVGSPLVVDAEEACARGGCTIVAGVRNVDAPVQTSAAVRIVTPSQLDDELRACPFIVALFTPGNRKAAVEHALELGFARGATLVDPTSAIARSATLYEGVFVNAGCVVAGAAHLGRFVLVNRSASIGHHAELADYASIGPGAVLCGHARIGRGAMVGAGTIVLPGVRIGANAVIGAGSVVRDEVADNTFCDGNPCRVVRTGIAGYKDLSA